MNPSNASSYEKNVFATLRGGNIALGEQAILLLLKYLQIFFAVCAPAVGARDFLRCLRSRAEAKGAKKAIHFY